MRSKRNISLLSAGSLKEISSGYNIVWGVNRHDHIYTRAISKSHPGGATWKLIGGLLKQVSVSSRTNNVWGVNRRDRIYYRIGANLRTPTGKHIWY